MRFLLLPAFLVAMTAASHASLFVIIDDFDSSLNTPAENTDGGNSTAGALSVYNPGATIFTGPSSTFADDVGSVLGGTRTTNFSIANTPAAAEGFATAIIGSGSLQIANPAEIDTDVNLIYNGSGSGLGSLGAGIAFFQIDLVNSDVVPFNFTVTVREQGDAVNTASTLSQSFTNSSGGIATFIFPIADFTLASGATNEFDFTTDVAGEIDFTISGDVGFDLAINSIGFSPLPEPTSIASLGLLCIGGVVGVRRRRRNYK